MWLCWQKGDLITWSKSYLHCWEILMDISIGFTTQWKVCGSKQARRGGLSRETHLGLWTPGKTSNPSASEWVSLKLLGSIRSIRSEIRGHWRISHEPVKLYKIKMVDFNVKNKTTIFRENVRYYTHMYVCVCV